MTADPYDDQFEAAATEAHNLFKAANARTDTIERPCTEDSIGGRIAERFSESLDAPDARMCPHVKGPQPIIGAAAIPGVIGCMDCMGPLIMAKHMMYRLAGKGRVCDGCGDNAEKWHDSLIQRGPLLMHVNICCFCMQMSEMDHDPETH